MNDRLMRKEFQPGHGRTREDWDAVDSPELTDEELAQLRPAKEVLPKEFFEAMDKAAARRGRPSLESPKKQVTLRLDADLIARYKASGKGWQSRINDDLRKIAGL
jgi:uncharacterized protein (DUF4415 family)